MTTVVKVNRKQDNFTLYIGRQWAGIEQSKWANPYHLYATQRVGPGKWIRVTNRSGCLAKYEAYIRRTPELTVALHEIDNQTLGCWCYDAPHSWEPGEELWCHGDVLIKLRKEQLDAK